MTADHICEALVKAGTMKAAARVLGVHRSTLGRWLRGRGIYVVRESGLIVEATTYSNEPEDEP